MGFLKWAGHIIYTRANDQSPDPPQGVYLRNIRWGPCVFAIRI